jgi:hypothetical protein
MTDPTAMSDELDTLGMNHRRYSADEMRAFKAAGLDPTQGPPQFASGHWWPDELERRANEAEALVPLLRLAAAALRREIAIDPLTAAVSVRWPGGKR